MDMHVFPDPVCHPCTRALASVHSLSARVPPLLSMPLCPCVFQLPFALVHTHVSVASHFRVHMPPPAASQPLCTRVFLTLFTPCAQACDKCCSHPRPCRVAPCISLPPHACCSPGHLAAPSPGLIPLLPHPPVPGCCAGAGQASRSLSQPERPGPEKSCFWSRCLLNNSFVNARRGRGRGGKKRGARAQVTPLAAKSFLPPGFSPAHGPAERGGHCCDEQASSQLQKAQKLGSVPLRPAPVAWTWTAGRLAVGGARG